MSPIIAARLRAELPPRRYRDCIVTITRKHFAAGLHEQSSCIETIVALIVMVHTANKPRQRPRQPILHPLTVRITHWLNAVAIIAMIGSGWRIYNQEPLFGFRFPIWLTLGGQPAVSQHWHNEEGLAGALQWHFAAMWLLFVSLIGYLVYGLLSGALSSLLAACPAAGSSARPARGISRAARS